MMAPIFLGLGSNLGDRERALAALRDGCPDPSPVRVDTAPGVRG